MKLLAYLEKHGLLELVEQAASDVVCEMTGYKLAINHRAKGRFGCVKYAIQTVELTSEYFVNGKIKEGQEIDHNNTLLHETAHVIVRYRYGNMVKAHGREWQNVMRSLGVKPERTSASSLLKAATEKTAKHIYTCKDCGHEFKKQRQLKNANNRRHGKCRHKPNGGTLNHLRVR